MSKQVENHKLRHKIQKRGEVERTWATFTLPLFLLFPLFPLLLFPFCLLLFRVSFIFILATLENVFEPYLSMYWFTVADTSRIRHHGSLSLSLSRCLSPPSLCLTNHGQCALKTHSLRVAAGKCGGGAPSLSLSRSAALPLDWLCIPLPSWRGVQGAQGAAPALYFVYLSRVFRKDFRFSKVLISSYNFTFSVFRNFDYFPTTDKLLLSRP